MMPGMNQPDGMMTWWMSGWGWLWVILLVVTLIVLLIWALSSAGRSAPSAPSRSEVDALDILEQRFARGEIDRDEFTSRRAALRDGDGNV